MLECYKESGKTNIFVDACIADEIKNLWVRGIRTTGCCCGHNRKFPYIGVVPEDIEKMRAMGYKPQFNQCRPADEDTFFPKIYYPYHDVCEQCGLEMEMCESCFRRGCPECEEGWVTTQDDVRLCPECYDALKYCPDFHAKDNDHEK
jgi:hypothetical protein